MFLVVAKIKLKDVTCSLPCKTPSKIFNENYEEVATETGLQITELENFYNYDFVSLPSSRICTRKDPNG
jgi:hypothetical protein